MKEKRAVEDGGDLAVLPPKKRGRCVLLGDDLDLKVQMYLKKVREGGGVVTARIAMAAAKGIVLTCDKSLLAEFGGHIELNRFWAYSLLHHYSRGFCLSIWGRVLHCGFVPGNCSLSRLQVGLDCVP